MVDRQKLIQNGSKLSRPLDRLRSGDRALFKILRKAAVFVWSNSDALDQPIACTV